MQGLILITSFLGECDFTNYQKCPVFANTIPWEWFVTSVEEAQLLMKYAELYCEGAAPGNEESLLQEGPALCWA